jgi:hypothetical protein
MYAGQGLIAKVDSANIKVGKPGVLEIAVAGDVDGPGFKNVAFLPRINAFAPKDGIYEVDVVADQPTTAAGPAKPTPIKLNEGWSPYPADHLKGVKFYAKSNSVVAMLPAAKP